MIRNYIRQEYYNHTIIILLLHGTSNTKDQDKRESLFISSIPSLRIILYASFFAFIFIVKKSRQDSINTKRVCVSIIYHIRSIWRWREFCLFLTFRALWWNWYQNNTYLYHTYTYLYLPIRFFKNRISASAYNILICKNVDKFWER